MTSNLIQQKIQSRAYKKMRRSSGHKLWISTPEIKYYNDKMNITIYIYNNTYNFYKKKLEFFQFIWGPKLEAKKNIQLEKNNKKDKFNLLKREYLIYIGTNKNLQNIANDFYQKMIKWLKLNKHTYMFQYKSYLLSLVDKKQNIQYSEFLYNIKIQNYNYLINQFNKELLYLKFKQKILFNEFKFTEVYLSEIIQSLQGVYNKKIEFNIITLKYFWLSTSILLQILTAKVKSPKNRGKYLVPLNYATGKIKIPTLSRNKFAGEVKPYIGVQNTKFDQFMNDKKDHLDQFMLTNITRSKIWLDKNIDGLVLSNLENKIIAGVFLKIAGRLTKRYKAQRTVKELKFKGTLKNVYSAHRNYSSSLSRGYSNINVEKATIHSNVRIGAFGLTGWVASY